MPAASARGGSVKFHDHASLRSYDRSRLWPTLIRNPDHPQPPICGTGRPLARLRGAREGAAGGGERDGMGGAPVGEGAEGARSEGKVGGESARAVLHDAAGADVERSAGHGDVGYLDFCKGIEWGVYAMYSGRTPTRNAAVFIDYVREQLPNLDRIGRWPMLPKAAVEAPLRP